MWVEGLKAQAVIDVPPEPPKYVGYLGLHCQPPSSVRTTIDVCTEHSLTTRSPVVGDVSMWSPGTFPDQQ
ncbi:ORF114 [White spot syndrome virus]|uniref:ORF114 n=1 Tax=White spot syndrome virus TaxID=342409 RepID=A0A2D3I6G9_9VIRU|nr:ORF114 [White spot syndrome virus]